MTTAASARRQQYRLAAMWRPCPINAAFRGWVSNSRALALLRVSVDPLRGGL